MALLQIYNSVLEDGEVPDCWRTTCFHMLPKKLRAMHASDFRPIANLRLLYKVFAYLILGRIEHTPDTYQPEEQHGFRSKYRLEEHLLTANLFLDKATAHGIPVWLVSLDLSKAFDRLHSLTLWNALRAFFFFFFFLTPFCRDRSQVRELFYWSASRHWDCFYTGQSPDVQSPR